ncbi:MAG: NAD(P)-binding domain-containing protein [Desulfobacterales bacterium]|nr:NAD(P)-binding domain-containing protein [Desulfobacterales bacterium]
MKVVCPDGIPEYQEMIKPMIAQARPYISKFTWFDGRTFENEEFVRRVGEAEGVILMWDFPGEAMKRCPNLKIISFAGIGAVKFVDISLARIRNIAVCNTPGYGDNAVAEHAIALMFAVARKIAYLDCRLRRGEWVHPLVMELHGKTLGLIGLGGIGARVAYLANRLGMKVLCWTRNPSLERAKKTEVEFVELNQIFNNSDIVSVHLKHLPETENIVTAKELSLMKPGSIFINTARGEIVNTGDLVKALMDGPLSGAGLDVFTQEPLPKDHPFCTMENVTLSPHIGYNTPEATIDLLQSTVDNIVAYRKGEPINIVNLKS